MNNRDDIEQYFIDLYRKTKNCNFEMFIETVFNYNIKIGDYNKPLFFDLQKNIFDSLTNDIPIMPEVKYWESLGYINSFILFNKFFKYYSKIVLDIPIFDYDMDKICPAIIKFIIYNTITCKISVHKKIKNPSFKIEVYDIKDADKIIDFFGSNNKINNVVKSRVIPFLIQKNYIGIYKEYDPYNFKNFYATNLYEFFNTCLDEKEVNINRFKDYLNKIYRFEKNPNKKRMYGFLIDYIYCYDDIDNYEKLFNVDKNLKINSLNPLNYAFIKEDKKFVSKTNPNEIISYGTSDYLGLMYYDFYENNIKADDYEKLYDDFCGIYDNLLSSNFKNTDIFINLLSNNNDIEYKIKYILSSGYFAYKKLGISLDIIYKLMDELLVKIKA